MNLPGRSWHELATDSGECTLRLSRQGQQILTNARLIHI